MLQGNMKNAALRFAGVVGGTTMALAKRFRRQAATCAALARQTHDDEGRERYLRLEQMYLQLVETEELASAPRTVVDQGIKPAA
jgi:hypothetical protein